MRWTQLNVALPRDPTRGSAQDHARRVFARLGPLVEEARAEGELEAFYFMRKAPDMRLRLGAGDERSPAVGRVGDALRALAEEGAVSRLFTSFYEPEERLFGGAEAMALVHEHFDLDSRAWITLDRLSAEGRATLPHDVVVSAVLNDLFGAALEGRSEIWDTWHNVALLAPRQGLAAPAAELTAITLRALSALATVEERQVLARYGEANRRLAGGLRRLWSAGRLGCGLRGLLPFVALFHFNRFGLGQAARADLARAMSEAWDPRRDMRGIER